jgi:SAM-dependent methyltransferase
MYLSEQYARSSLLGVDISPKMVAHANAKVPGLNAVVGSGFELPFASDSVDLVVSLDGVFDAREMARVCAPDGAVLVVYSKGGSCPVSRNIDAIAQEFTEAGMHTATRRESWWAVWSVFEITDG